MCTDSPVSPRPDLRDELPFLRAITLELRSIAERWGGLEEVVQPVAQRIGRPRVGLVIDAVGAGGTAIGGSTSMPV